MLILPGSNALSAFRTQRLLSQLPTADAAIAGITARFLHFVDVDDTLSQDDVARLDALLGPEFGTPFEMAVAATVAPFFARAGLEAKASADLGRRLA